MPAHMGRNFRQLHLVDAVVFLADVLEVMLPVKRHHRLAVLVQVQKAAPSADHRIGFGLRPVGDNALEALVHIVRHRDFPRSAGGFRVLNDVLHIPLSLKLVVDADFAVLHVQISQGQPYKLRNAKSRLEQDINAVVVPGKMRVTLYKFQKCPSRLPWGVCPWLPTVNKLRPDGGVDIFVRICPSLRWLSPLRRMRFLLSRRFSLTARLLFVKRAPARYNHIIP